jgi:hypothetical protein
VLVLPLTTATSKAASGVGGTITIPPNAFVVGDLNAAVGSQVEFWGAQWAKDNSLSGGGAPDSFKGYADTVVQAGDGSCAGSWTSAPGNSSAPPASIPAEIVVVVSSSVQQSGSAESGNVVDVVLVQTNSGYAGDPGHAGTGTVVQDLCA